MAETLRLFLALPLAPGLEQSLQQAQEGLDSHGLDLDFTRPGTWHLTLHFLGSTPARLLEDLRHDLGACFHRHRRFDLSLQGMGCFPSPDEPRVLWAGIGDPHGRLAALHQDSRRVLDQYRLFKLEDRPYSPHLSLARVKGQSPSFDARAFGLALKAWDRPASFPVEQGILFQSQFLKDGMRHEALQRYPLSRG
jgi:2'-5' RNA ligase